MEYHAIDTEKLTCKECGDTYTLCRCRHGVCTKNDDGRCMDCHIELVHNIVPDCEENTNLCGNEIGYPEEDKIYFPGICDKFYRV